MKFQKYPFPVSNYTDVIGMVASYGRLEKANPPTPFPICIAAATVGMRPPICNLALVHVASVEFIGLIFIVKHQQINYPLSRCNWHGRKLWMIGKRSNWAEKIDVVLSNIRPVPNPNKGDRLEIFLTKDVVERRRMLRKRRNDSPRNLHSLSWRKLPRFSIDQHLNEQEILLMIPWTLKNTWTCKQENERKWIERSEVSGNDCVASVIRMKKCWSLVGGRHISSRPRWRRNETWQSLWSSLECWAKIIRATFLVGGRHISSRPRWRRNETWQTLWSSLECWAKIIRDYASLSSTTTNSSCCEKRYRENVCISNQKLILTTDRCEEYIVTHVSECSPTAINEANDNTSSNNLQKKQNSTLCHYSFGCDAQLVLKFNPVDNYLIDCGSSKNTSVGTRLFVADDSDLITLSTPQTLFVNTTSKPDSSAIDLALYQTATVFDGTSNYTFPIKKQGGHWIRIYFYPFNHKSRNLSTARFSVSAQSLTLLRDFRPPSVPVVKEYVLNITSASLVLNFIPYKDSFGFVNALEVISIPDELIPNSAKTFSPSGEQSNLWKHALEKVVRVNMGKLVVNPENDSLWRHWDSDFSYLKHDNLVKFVENITAVNYTGFPTKDIAPASVYGTATKLDTELDPNSHTNMTWLFDVDPGFNYFVRFHFCDIVSLEPKQMFFNVYINSLLVVRDLDLSKQTSNILRSPYYIDFVSRARNSRNLSISIGPSEAYNAYPNGILNGLEIMKISDFKGSLDLGETKVQSSSSNSKIKSWTILGSVIVVTFVAVVLALVFFMMWRRRKLADVNHSAQDKFGNKGRKSTDGTATISSSNFGYSFPLAVIKEATENFNDGLIIGVGGFGKWLSQGELEKLVDPYVAEEIKPESLKSYGEIAEKCLAERGVDRPTMGEILWKLECALQLQGISVRPRLNNQPSNSHFEDSVLSTQYSVGSDIDGVSMSKVFSAMVKTEMR
ncbi:hypothetical protein POM88_019387 [Heracleum sosnowskyi]|uniref:Malectin-like domain-containing protein n=1 Tax=Heracleum sosnowskyi TaxID=360622 RepID=A0AAD8I9C7_9APIA|nr:hypothetical protein POM88_019387 [Heracleum sosnowskyi]